MQKILPPVLSALTLASVFGCAHTAPTTTKLAVTPVAVAAPAAASAKAAPTVRVEAGAADEATLAAADAPVTPVAGAPKPPTDDTAVPEAVIVDAEALAAAAPRRSAATGEAGTANILDPYRPYGLGVVAKSGTTVTLAWRTDLDSKATIYYGKTFGLSWNGYEGVFHENHKSKFHQVTIGGLSRFRSYTFSVIGEGFLGMQFPTYPFKTRTNLF